LPARDSQPNFLLHSSVCAEAGRQWSAAGQMARGWQQGRLQAPACAEGKGLSQCQGVSVLLYSCAWNP